MQAKLDPRPWLPGDAIEADRVASWLDRLLAEWSSHWFASERASASPTYQDDWPAPGVATEWRSIPGLAAVALTANVHTALASAMLGSTIPPGSIQANDRAVLEHLAAAAVDDLLGKLAGLAGHRAAAVGEPAELDQGRTWDIAFRSGRRAFKLSIARDGLVAITRRSLPAAAAAKLCTVRKGLEGQQVELVADLGRSSVAIADLEELRVGDVMVLDRAGTDRVELLIDGFHSPLGGLLERVGGQTCLVLNSIKDDSHV